MSEENGQAKQNFDSWAILELMGKVRLGGRVREEHVFGVAMIRIDLPQDKECSNYSTRYFHPNALYGITPVEKEVAIAVALYNNAPPAHAWELKEKKSLGAGADAEAELDFDGECEEEVYE